MSVIDVKEPLERWAETGEPVAVATLVGVRGSAPREPGARFALAGSGEIAGSVSSGCVEGDLHQHLESLLDGRAAPSVLEYGITDELALTVGLSCGGTIQVLVDRHEPDDAWRHAVAAADSDKPSVLVTGLSETIRSRRIWLGADGTRVGSLGDPELDSLAVERAHHHLGFEAGVNEELDGERLFIEPLTSPPRLVIVGATPIGVALCRLASVAGYRVWVLDPREAFTDPRSFPDAQEVRVEWPDEGLERVGVDPWTDVVVLTHDQKLDVPALQRALEARARYVGLLGGRRTQSTRREALLERGVDEETLNRVHGPVGLDIGARTPPEIAVSILAELIAARRIPG